MRPAAVSDAWKDLRAGGRILSGEYRVCETGTVLSSGKVLFALDEKDRRHLLIPLAGDEKATEDRKSSGVQILLRELLENQERRRFASVVCHKPHLYEPFSVLTGEMLARLKADRDSPPVHVCRRVLDRWRELLEKEASPLLGAETLTGLFSELWHLREVVRLNPDRVEIWLGPDGARHDLSTGSTALEVKATLKRHGRVFLIKGHDQLEPPEGGTLYLAAMKLEMVQSGGESIPELITSIRSLGVDYHLLLTKLARVGYDVEDSAAYNSVRFTVNEDRVYEVNQDFPRIVSASFAGDALPAGVVRLDYQIDLSGRSPEPLSLPERKQVYHRIAGIE